MSYTRERIESLIPGVWDEWRVLEAQDDLRPDPEMPKAQQHDPRQSTNLVTEVADIQRAWALAPTTLKQRQAVVLRYGLDFTYDEVAKQFGITLRAAVKRCDAGVDNLGLFLNGAPFKDRQDATTDS